MSDKHVKGIVDAVEQSEIYSEAMKSVPEGEKAHVKTTVEGFAKLLGPMVEAVEQLEASEEVVKAVRARLAEKLRGG